MREIAALSNGLLQTREIAATITIGLAIYTHPTGITDEQVEELRGFDYSDREIIDVITLNVLAGAFNLIAGLEPERPKAMPPGRHMIDGDQPDPTQPNPRRGHHHEGSSCRNRPGRGTPGRP